MTVSDGTQLRDAMRRVGLSLRDLWLGYVSLGGSLPPDVIDRFCRSAETLQNHDYDLIAQAINERYIERGELPPLPYAEEIAP